jgi:hypothetical protein
MDDPAYGLSVADRAKVIDAMLSAEDYDAELAERCGWVNRALPAASSQARRISRTLRKS